MRQRYDNDADVRDHKGDLALRDLQKHISALCVEPYKTFSKWHAFGLPGPEYGWSRLAGWSAAVLKFYTGFDCGKFLWLPSLDHRELTPARVVWLSPDPNEEIPPILLALFPFAMVSVVLTPRVDRLMAASPAILTIASSSPWTVDGTFNTANNTIYCVGAGGIGFGGSSNLGGTGGGGGAIAFASNYNNGWSPGSSTATFQVKTGQSSANNSAGNTTFDSSKFVAACGGSGQAGNVNTVPAGGTTHNGGSPGTTPGSGGGGGGGGGAAGTTGDGASGGATNTNGNSGGGGGGGADGGTAGTAAVTNTPGNGGASGLSGSTGGTGGTSPTSGTGGGGGGGGNGGPTVAAGAVGSAGASGSVTPQFDATHGCGGGGGGGGGQNGGSLVVDGGSGGQYGGGGGGQGHATGVPSLGGNGGDGLIFITWVAAPAGSATPIFGIFGGIEGSVTALALLKTLIDNNPIVSRRILLPKCKDGK